MLQLSTFDSTSRLEILSHFLNKSNTFEANISRLTQLIHTIMSGKRAYEEDMEPSTSEVKLEEGGSKKAKKERVK
jgi:hypothetical protein